MKSGGSSPSFGTALQPNWPSGLFCEEVAKGRVRTRNPCLHISLVRGGIFSNLGSKRADTAVAVKNFFTPQPPIGCAPERTWAELECAFLNSYQARWQRFADTIG